MGKKGKRKERFSEKVEEEHEEGEKDDAADGATDAAAVVVQGGGGGGAVESEEDAAKKKQKGKLKKLKKLVARGEVYTKARLDECLAAGLLPRPTVTVAQPTAVNGARVPTLTDLATLVHRTLGPSLTDDGEEAEDEQGFFFKEAGTRSEAKRDWPPWLELGNAACVRRLVLVFVAGLDEPTAFLKGALRTRVFGAKDDPRKRDALDVLLSVAPPWEITAKKQQPDQDGRSVTSNRQLLQPFLVAEEEMRRNQYPALDHDDALFEEQDEPVAKRVKVDEEEDCGLPLTSPLPLLEDALKIVASCKCVKAGVSYVKTTASLKKQKPRVWALDCEMVTTGRGLELARCTLLDSAGESVLDELVMPEVAITDYNSQWSGLTEASLSSVRTRLSQVQACVLKFVRKGDVLVGHSLENDLRALKVSHADCADTALLFPHHRGPGYKRALRHLTYEFLGRSIQQGAAHDSREDALAALDLFKLKLERGLNFGLPNEKTNPRAEACLESMARRGCRVAVIAADPTLLQRVARGAVAAVKVADNAKVLQETAKHANAGWHLLLSRVDRPADDASFPETLDAHLKKVHAALPRDALLVVATQPDLRRASELERQKVACRDARASSVWTEKLEEERLDALDSAMFGTLSCFAAPPDIEPPASASDQ